MFNVAVFLLQAEEDTFERAKKQLRMPPVLDERKEISEIIEHDELLNGHDEDSAKLVFTDVSLDAHNRVRWQITSGLMAACY